VHFHHPPAATEWNALAAITSCSSRWDHSIPAGGDFGSLRVVYVW